MRIIIEHEEQDGEMPSVAFHVDTKTATEVFDILWEKVSLEKRKKD